MTREPVRLLTGDCRTVLDTLDAGSVQTCVTSPPYFGLRDYGNAAQIGLEATPDAYIAELVAVFRSVRRVLADDGTLWLNLGDSYATTTLSNNNTPNANRDGSSDASSRAIAVGLNGRKVAPDVPAKNLIGIPWRVAFALQADGWFLRADIIWSKPNPMPESVTDRPTKAHEYVFLLAKSARYFYDADAIAEEAVHAGRVVAYDGEQKNVEAARDPRMRTRIASDRTVGATRNARSVWTIATQPYAGAHFATFPVEMARRCIVAGSRPGDTVLDPFSGSGTVASVASGHGRYAIGIDVNPAYHDLARDRIGPMLCSTDGAA